MSNPVTLCLPLMLALFALGGVGSLFFREKIVSSLWGTVFAILGSLSAFLLGISALFGGVKYLFVLPAIFPGISFGIYIDQLGGMFLALLAFISLIASIYGYGYMRHYGDSYHLGGFYFFYNIFLGSMFLVVMASQAFIFLLAWEMMSLASYALVVFEHKEEESVRAGFLYFIITHIATAFIVILFFILHRVSGSFDFAVWRQGLEVGPALSTVIFILAIIGFGTKAGIIPFHIWLPRAHPAAPSHVSAIMSGVMIKTGIYMLIRVFVDFFSSTPLWLGVLVILLGVLSSLLGVLYALGEHDIKKLLAYHSIENIGIILLGIGAALLFRSTGEHTAALLALAAALFHTTNHAVFKSLLFMSAGSVVAATHTRNIEKYGGLIKRMPETALFFLVGSIAISGIVPFNGFVSEWTTFQSLFNGLHLAGVTGKIVTTVGIAALAFTGGLAAACFVKAFGVTFLARSRSAEAQIAPEAGSGMRIAMAILAFATLCLGIFGGNAALVFLGIANSFPSLFAAAPVAALVGGKLEIVSGLSSINIPFVFLLLLATLLITWLFFVLAGNKQKLPTGRTWDCGFLLTPRMEITATGFAHSLLTIFFGPFRSRLHIDRGFSDPEKMNFVRSIAVQMHMHDVYHKYVYDPAARAVISLAERMNKIQSGGTHTYLLYMLFALVTLLVWATHQ